MTSGKRILVLGAGVIGLTTALVLRRRGRNVTVLAELFAPNITSSVAGALWEMPPGVCGKHVDLERARRWAAISLRAFTELAEDSSSVFLRPVTFYFRHELKNDPFQREKMARIREIIPNFRHDAVLIRENGIGPVHEYRDAYRHLAPMIDTDAYLPWLLDRVRKTGCEVVTRRVSPPLADAVPGLLKEFGAAAIVNCTGFSSRELAEDESVYPLRGAVIRVRNDGVAMPRIEEAHCVPHDGVSSDPGFIFIVPRGRDKLLLGGFAQPDEENIGLDLRDEQVQDMLRRCIEFLPALKHADLDTSNPVRVGLRPARELGVRLEWDWRLPVLHNYGHGGSGVTYSWGCAEEVAYLLAIP